MLYAVAMPIDSKLNEAGIAVVTISGRLVFGREAERLEAVVTNLLKSGQTRFVFDASALEYVDSSGIGTIVSCLTQIKKSGAELKMAGANPRIMRLLTMTGVDKLLTLYPSVAEATAS
jgi:anti-sigma B factor antagonist